MGGAVIAALTAWRFRQKSWSFYYEVAGLEKKLYSKKNNAEYIAAKRSAIARMEDWFLPGGRDADHRSTSCSCFSSGDVDVFVQASPLTRSLVSRELFGKK